MLRKKLLPSVLITVIVAVLLLALAAVPIAAAPGGSGKGGGGGGGGGQPGGGGKGEIYSDLVIAYRDLRGLPMLADFDTDKCVQPVFYGTISGLPQVRNPVDGAQVTLIPLLGDALDDPGVTAEESEELEVCDPHPDYAGYVTEVLLERLNQGRSPSKVVERQLTEVSAMVTGAELSLEASGRLVADGVTIDSPLMNTAIYQSLMLDDGVPDLAGELVVLPTPEIASYSYDNLHHGAVAVAMAAGKEVPINVDSIVYHNRVLDIPRRTTHLSTIEASDDTECEVGGHDYDDERFTSCGIPGETYVDYSQAGFTYDRAATFTGSVTYYPDYVSGQPVVADILDVVFGGDDVAASGLAGVAQHADDARRVNLWFHDHEPAIVAWDAPGEDSTSEDPTP